MKGAVKLGWWVPEDVWDGFLEYVQSENGATGDSLQYHVCVAMTQYLDQDQHLAEAEGLLRDLLDVRGLSSSTTVFVNGRYEDTDTTKVQLRVKRDLKEEFQKFVDKHDGPSYGRALAHALDSYADGGRGRRVRELVDALVIGVENGSGGGTIGSVEESDLSIDSFNGSTGGTAAGVEESTVSTDGGTGSTGGTTSVDADEVLTIVDELADNLSQTVIPQKLLDEKIVKTVGSGNDDVLEAYRESVLSQVNAEPHPHHDGRYITKEYRDSHQIYGDMDRAEREIMLRRYVALDAADRQTLSRGYSYTEVQELFEVYAGGGKPSPQYAYDLMEGAAEEKGFEYGDYHDEVQLRVDLSEVSRSVRGYVAQEGFKSNLDDLGVNARLEDYDPNWQSGNGEAAADD